MAVARNARCVLAEIRWRARPHGTLGSLIAINVGGGATTERVDESGALVPLPKPEVLSRNGTFMAYRIQEHVGAFRDFLRQHGGPTAQGQELIAAKLMGRYVARSDSGSVNPYGHGPLVYDFSINVTVPAAPLQFIYRAPSNRGSIR